MAATRWTRRRVLLAGAAAAVLVGVGCFVAARIGDDPATRLWIHVSDDPWGPWTALGVDPATWHVLADEQVAFVQRPAQDLGSSLGRLRGEEWAEMTVEEVAYAATPAVREVDGRPVREYVRDDRTSASTALWGIQTRRQARVDARLAEIERDLAAAGALDGPADGVLRIVARDRPLRLLVCTLGGAPKPAMHATFGFHRDGAPWHDGEVVSVGNRVVALKAWSPDDLDALSDGETGTVR